MKLLILTIVMFLSSCASVDQQIADEVCGLFPGISYSGVGDTAPTKEQIKTFNAKREAFCK